MANTIIKIEGENRGGSGGELRRDFFLRINVLWWAVSRCIPVIYICICLNYRCVLKEGRGIMHQLKSSRKDNTVEKKRREGNSFLC